MFSLDWPRAYGLPKSTAHFKLTPEDFHVNEFFDKQFSGEGEHIIIKIEKKGLTTEEVIKSLSRIINKPVRQISYAGLKDRQSLSTQYISIHAPGEEINGIDSVEATGWRVIECTRHNKKLRPGFLSGNQFFVRLRDISNEDDVISRIEQIKAHSVPNYFGEQRFGREGGNLIKAEQMLVHGVKIKDRFLKSMYYSAARSWIFNQILSKRVSDLTWNMPQAGDVMQLSGTNSIFVIDEIDDALLQRVKNKDISPASPLPGISKKKVEGKALEMINTVYSNWLPWISGLEQHGLEEAWRPNILYVDQFEYCIQNKNAELSFILPSGSYATSVLRELVIY